MTPERWTPNRKKEILAQISAGEMTADEACARHSIDPEELEGWARRFRLHGLQGLSVMRLQMLSR